MRGHVHAGPDEGARRDEREGFSRKGREGRQTSEKARDDEKPYGGRQLGIRARPGECGADQKAARDEVFRVAAEIQTALRASTTLGVPGVLWLSFTNLRLEQAQGAGGAGALLTFQIDFTARI